MNKVVSPEDFIKLPWWFRALNRSWKSAYLVGMEVKLDKDSLIRSARRSTGLKDLGKDFWDEPLDRMLNSINNEARLHPIGRFISRERIVNLLSNRLRAEYFFQKNPEILEQDLYPVWMIAGLQRTGTTKLQRLLNVDSENRVLASWEAINPAPFLKKTKGEDKRLKKARTAEKALKVMAPGFFAIHPVEYLAPEEDILLLDISFLSTTPEATMHVPSYADWLEKNDQSMAYEYAVKLMKLLQWQRPAKRWILKSPHHLEFLDVAQNVLGDVRFLWTHRDPCVSIPSFLSMMSHSRAMFSNATSLEQVSDHWVRKSTFILEKGMEFRKTQADNKFLDIKYDDLVQDAITQLGRIYGNIDDELRMKFMKAENENPPQKYGKHVYSLEDFNLNEEDIRSRIPLYSNFIKKVHSA